MINKKSIFDTIMKALCGRTSEDTVEDTPYSLGKGYDEYLKKSPEYQDQVIISMYKGTRFENESPEKLRQILRAQVAVKSNVLQ